MDGKASTDGQAEEEVNVEYVKNVVLQFLEHKEMRVSIVDPTKDNPLLTALAWYSQI